MNGINVLKRRDLSLPCDDTAREGTQLQTRRRTLIRHHISWHPDLELPSFQNCEK